MLGLRLYLPESWTSDTARMAGVPEDFQAYRTKLDIAIKEIDRVIGSRPSMWCRIGCGQRAAFSGGLGCNL